MEKSRKKSETKSGKKSENKLIFLHWLKTIVWLYGAWRWSRADLLQVTSYPIIASFVYSQDVLLIATVSQEGTQREVNLEVETFRVFNEHCSYLNIRISHSFE